jgi:hypothetical protein
MKVLSIISACAIGLGAAFARPSSVFSANVEFATRREKVITAWLAEFAGDFTRMDRACIDGTTDRKCQLRKIAAALAAIKYGVPGAPSRATFPAVVEAWLRDNMYQDEEPGSSGKSFDMTLIQMINLVYAFKDDPDLLTPNARNYLLGVRPPGGALRPYLMGWDLKNMVFTMEGNSFPETENHVLMLNIWQYLATERALNTLLFPDVINHWEDGSSLEAGLLAILGRIPQNGFFEANARPYQVLTVHALITLYSYANPYAPGGLKIKTAAKNALDYIFLHFAFQSIDAKRYGGQRRNWDDYRTETGMNKGDYMQMVAGMLTGVNYYNDDYSSFNVQEKGYALWASLSEYRVPDPILDFYINPDLEKKGYGFWARMQTRFSGQHYNKGEWSRYAVVQDPYLYHTAIPSSMTGVTNGHGDPDLRAANVEPALEFYFGTRDYLNSAGGHYDHYPALNLATLGDKVYVYDFFTKPSVLIPAGGKTWSDLADAGKKVVVSEGLGKPWALTHHKSDGSWGCHWWPPGCYVEYSNSDWTTQEPGYLKSNNIGTYKNMMLGYNTDFAKQPISVPSTYVKALPTMVFYNAADGLRQVDIYDPGSEEGLKNHYVIVYRTMEKTSTRNYNRAVMEVIPKSKYTPDALLSQFQSNNIGKSYDYKLILSGEEMIFNPNFGKAEEELQSPFLSIKKDGVEELADVHVNVANQAAVNAFPLIDVRQVNGSFDFTGVLYASAWGDGYVYLNNPRYGAYHIDSRNFLVPATTVPDANEGFTFGLKVTPPLMPLVLD